MSRKVLLLYGPKYIQKKVIDAFFNQAPNKPHLLLKLKAEEMVGSKHIDNELNNGFSPVDRCQCKKKKTEIIRNNNNIFFLHFL